MSFVFNLLGTLAILVSAAWAALLFSNAQGAPPLGLLIAMVPAISVFGSGIVLLAIGAGLDYLRRIARNTADTADATESMLALMKEPRP